MLKFGRRVVIIIPIFDVLGFGRAEKCWLYCAKRPPLSKFGMGVIIGSVFDNLAGYGCANNGWNLVGNAILTRLNWLGSPTAQRT